jgi:hypothetical protein
LWQITEEWRQHHDSVSRSEHRKLRVAEDGGEHIHKIGCRTNRDQYSTRRTISLQKSGGITMTTVCPDLITENCVYQKMVCRTFTRSRVARTKTYVYHSQHHLIPSPQTYLSLSPPPQFFFLKNKTHRRLVDKGLRDFYHNWTNSILHQLKRKFWKITETLFRIS